MVYYTIVYYGVEVVCSFAPQHHQAKEPSEAGCTLHSSLSLVHRLHLYMFLCLFLFSSLWKFCYILYTCMIGFSWWSWIEASQCLPGHEPHSRCQYAIFVLKWWRSCTDHSLKPGSPSDHFWWHSSTIFWVSHVGIDTCGNQPNRLFVLEEPSFFSSFLSEVQLLQLLPQIHYYTLYRSTETHMTIWMLLLFKYLIYLK